MKSALADGLFAGAQYLLEEANKLCPHDTGALEASGYAGANAAAKEASVSYNTPYAARLHEHPEYQFQDGRMGKWLEKTFEEHGEETIAYIAAKAREAL
jgi:hypothetical protein